MLRRLDRRWVVAAIAVGVLAILLLCAVAGIECQGLMFLAPLLAAGVWLALASPVEGVLGRWVRSRCSIPARALGAPEVHWFSHLPLPRGTVLMALGLAVRPPPAGLPSAL